MDFSTPSRALESIVLRQPPLNEDGVIEWCKKMSNDPKAHMLDGSLFLLKQDKNSKIDNDKERSEFARWERLAVGIYIATELLQHQTKVRQQEQLKEQKAVYMEGPRVPQEVLIAGSSNNSASTAATSSTSSTNYDASIMDGIFLSDVDVCSLCEALHYVCSCHFEHKEPRIRTLTGKAVGAQVTWSYFIDSSRDNEDADGINMINKLKANCLQMHDTLVRSIEEHIQTGRDEVSNQAAAKEKKQDPNTATNETDPVSTRAVLDDTTGWRALETNWQCLACWIQGSMEHYVFLFLNDEKKNYLETLSANLNYSCVEHVNRHVRAAGMLVLEHLIRSIYVAATKQHEYSLLLMSSDSKLRKVILEVSKHGLADNWSQVRMAASVLCREFLVHILFKFPKLEEELQQKGVDITINSTDNTDWEKSLLPRMCLNRFYLAQGVKLYSHETWRMVFAENGFQRVQNALGPICRYYVKMCDADNHVVREAACQAVAELVSKFGSDESKKDLLQPFIPILLQALIMCFHDESWPVRDEACLACGTFCKSFPTECSVELETLMERWTEQLTDQIWSVREDAAVALGDAIEAYGNTMLQRLLKFVKKNLPSAKDQPPMTREEHKKKHNDIESHTDLQTYSCGSLAPKLRKGGAGRIGCGSCGITRPKAPWEATDGCIYLIRELSIRCCGDNTNSDIALTDKELLPLLTELADVCRVQHFPQSDDLRTTLWKQLPVMAMHIGKQKFKSLYLELFLDLLMENLDRKTASELSIHAAGQCLEELSNFVGPMILRGRMVDDHQRQTLDRILNERNQQIFYQHDPAGFGSGAITVDKKNSGFSPFGPQWLLDSVMGKPL